MNKYHEIGIDEPNIKDSLKDCSGNIASTAIPGSDLGNFAGTYDLQYTISRFTNPVLLSSVDGVGTKVRILKQNNRVNKIGVDLVAMCVNDIIAQGGTPYLFLDYYASSKFESDEFKSFIIGLSHGCKIANCALIGGETAIMPGVYKEHEIDVVGCAIGFGNKDEIFTFKNIQNGDLIIGLQSSGPHSNGYSLINTLPYQSADSAILESILASTIIYTDVIPYIPQLKAACHITGGGIYENISRVLPNGVKFKIDNWDFPEVFDWIQRESKCTYESMLEIFNCGIGMALIVTPHLYDYIQSQLSKYKPKIIGKIINQS